MDPPQKTKGNTHIMKKSELKKMVRECLVEAQGGNKGNRNSAKHMDKINASILDLIDYIDALINSDWSYRGDNLNDISPIRTSALSLKKDWEKFLRTNKSRPYNK